MKKLIRASSNTVQLEVDTSELDLSQISNFEEAENFINHMINEVDSYLSSKCPGIPFKLRISGPTKTWASDKRSHIWVSVESIETRTHPLLDHTVSLYLENEADGSYFLPSSSIDKGYNFLDQILPEYARKQRNNYNWMLKKESNELQGVPIDVIAAFSHFHSFLQSHIKTAKSVEDLIEDLEYEYPLNLKLKKTNRPYWESNSREVEVLEDYINANNMSLQEIKTFANLCYKYYDIKR